MNFTEQQIEERFGKLPPHVQKAIQSNHVEETVRAVGSRHALHIDQIGKLVDITLLLMLGLIEPKRFSMEIQNELKIGSAASDPVAQDLSDSLFVPIRESMQTLAAQSTSQTAKPLSAPSPGAAALKALPPAEELLLAPHASVPTVIDMSPKTAAPAAGKPRDPYREPTE